MNGTDYTMASGESRIARIASEAGETRLVSVGSTRTTWLARCELLTAKAVIALILCTAGVEAAAWRHVTEAEGLAGRQIQFIKRCGDDIWVGTLQGLTVFRNGKPTSVLKGDATWDVLPLANDDVWIGTGNGVVRQTRGASKRSLPGESVGRILPFGAKTVWALCTKEDRSRVMEFSAGTWQPVPAFKKATVTNMHPTRNGNIWVVLKADGIVEANPAQEPAKWIHHQRGFNITAFYEDEEQRVWCGTWARGILMHEGDTWTRTLQQEDGAVTAIRKDGKGNVWAATNDRGLWQYDGTKWINHLKEEGTINMLEVATGGRVLVSSQSVCSLRQWNGKGWDVLVDVPTMFLTTVYDSNGKVWAGNILDGLYIEP